MAPPNLTVEALLAHRDWVRSLAERLLGDPNDVDDVEQQTWLSALRSPPEERGTPRAWLGTVVRNLVRERRRRDGRRDHRERITARREATPATDDVVATAEAHGKVVRAVLDLPEPFRTTILHRFFDGMPPRDIAARMGVPVETVRSRTRRALARLREHLDTSCGGDGRAWGALLLPLVEAGPPRGLGVGAAAVTSHKILLVVVCTVGFAVISTVWFVGLAPQPEGLVTTGHDIPDDPDGPEVKGERVPRVRIDKPTPTAVPTTTAAANPPASEPTASDTNAPHVSATGVRPDLHRSLPASSATAAWDKLFETTLRKARDEYVKNLAKWCDRNELEWTANYVRRRAFVYRPDDAEMRERFAYYKQRDGSWVQNESKSAWLRTIVDLDDPNSTNYPKNIQKADRKVAKLFLALARKAEKAADDAPDTATRALFEERARRAWEWALVADPEERDAHKALGHPTFEGEYVTPFALPFLEARGARREQGETHARKSHPARSAAPGGFLLQSGLRGVAVRSDHWQIQTTHSQAVAERLVLWAERALDLLLATHGGSKKTKKIKKSKWYDTLDVVDVERDELRQFLTRGVGLSEADVERFVGQLGGTLPRVGTSVMATAAGGDADGAVVHYAAHSFVESAREIAERASRSRRPDARDAELWLRESIANDTAYRLTGDHARTCGAFGGYGQAVKPRPGEDLWILFARRQVEMDDDVPTAELWRKGLDDLHGPATVKGYALLQFLFERDATNAREFVDHALAHGTPAAVMDVYGADLGVASPDTAKRGKEVFDEPPYREAMGRLDARYREWIIRTY